MRLAPSHFPFSCGRARGRGAVGDQTGFVVSAKAPAIWRIIFRVGSSLAVRSSPEAVSRRTPRLTPPMPSSWAISSRAQRLASSTMTVRTPLLEASYLAACDRDVFFVPGGSRPGAFWRALAASPTLDGTQLPKMPSIKLWRGVQSVNS